MPVSVLTSVCFVQQPCTRETTDWAKSDGGCNARGVVVIQGKTAVCCFIQIPRQASEAEVTLAVSVS